MMMNRLLIKDAVLRVGEVSGIEGRNVFVLVDKDKNSSDLLFEGEILKNISVGSYIEIRKGFLSIIGKVEGEELQEDKFFSKDSSGEYQRIDKNKRILNIALSGYIGFDGRFIGGIKELPLIGNEAFILTEKKIHTIHNLIGNQDNLKINIARTDIDDIPISFPIDGLFNSHIAIFGNTGSGKSNTLAALYQRMIETLKERKKFENNCKLFFFDFNGEYTGDDCIHPNKTVYELSTMQGGNDKIPMQFDELIDIETLSILFEASEKTQKPFLKRALGYYKFVKNSPSGDFLNHFKNILKKDIKDVLLMANKDVAYKILDFLEEIFSFLIDEESLSTIRDDLRYHNTHSYFCLNNNQDAHCTRFSDYPDKIEDTNLFKCADSISQAVINGIQSLDMFFIFVLLKLIEDLHRYKVQLEHVLPVVNRFKAKKSNIDKLFNISEDGDLWDDSNIVVLSLHDVNLDMRKTIPLLMAKHIYNEHKRERGDKSLSIIIDEAHNILSKTSFRETEDWKDYRLETFEEIIKEGRKFGVFVTISSQRPNDISDTIISQAHNYFIHQLINQRDLYTIGNAVSYIDKVTEESIPTLPVGTCIFSGIATPMPLKIKIDELDDDHKPNSTTLKFKDIVGEAKDE